MKTKLFALMFLPVVLFGSTAHAYINHYMKKCVVHHYDWGDAWGMQHCTYNSDDGSTVCSQCSAIVTNQGGGATLQDLNINNFLSGEETVKGSLFTNQNQ